MRALRIATRKSPLALWQANYVAGLLRDRQGLPCELLELSTEGDRFLAAKLQAIGGKGLFVKEIEAAVHEGRADLAVHSLKDMTSEIPPGLVLACIPAREDPRDAFVGRAGATFGTLPRGARVGTSSLRRTCQLLEARPDLEIVNLRGNVQTRLRKVEELGLHGTVLANAGLLRLGLQDVVTEVIPMELCLPAVGQGALAVECRADDAELRAWLQAIEDPLSRTAVTAERAFLARLEGGCSVPLAAHAVVESGRVRVKGLVGSPDGSRILRAEREGPAEEAASLGEALAEALLSQGARELLALHAGRAG